MMSFTEFSESQESSESLLAFSQDSYGSAGVRLVVSTMIFPSSFIGFSV